VANKFDRNRCMVATTIHALDRASDDELLAKEETLIMCELGSVVAWANMLDRTRCMVATMTPGPDGAMDVSTERHLGQQHFVSRMYCDWIGFWNVLVPF
jgi:hypothetical protein